MSEDDAKDAAWDRFISNEIGVWFERLSDHDAALVRSAFTIAWSEGAKYEVDKTLDLKCEDCHKVKPDVIGRKCPYAEDLHGTVEMVTICDRCNHNRCMDI